MNVPIKYLPKHITKKDKKTISYELKKSRKAYKKNKYITRKQISSYKSKPSQHILNVKKLYNIDKLVINSNLSRKTGCSINSLRKIVNKGQGAYYSSGSRPNQTSHSWGLARLASSISGGKASAIDYKILENGCSKSSKALKLAKKAKLKYKNGTHRVRKTKLF
jgi:hypothetical protein